MFIISPAKEPLITLCHNFQLYMNQLQGVYIMLLKSSTLPECCLINCFLCLVLNVLIFFLKPPYSYIIDYLTNFD